MSVPYQQWPSVVAKWLSEVRAELADLRSDVAALWRSHQDRLRSDPAYRRALTQGALRALLAILARGPRATVLGLVALVCEVVLAVLNALQDGFGGPEYA